MTDTTTPPAPSIDLLSITALLLRKKWRIAQWTAAAGVAGIVLALLWKPYFNSTAVILPPQQQQSLASALTAQLPQLAGMSGLGALGGLKNPGDMYVGIMQGRAVSDWIIDKLHLDSIFHQRLHSGTISRLQHSVTFESSRDGLIRITAKASTPQLAADIANAYVDSLYNVNSRLAISSASQRRLFFQRQVDDERKQLNDAEDAMKTMQQKTGMLQLSGQTALLLRQIEVVRSQITSHEVQLRALAAFATDENPEVQRLQQELSALRSQLTQLETNQRTASMTQMPTINQVPTVGLEYLRKMRDVQYHESLFALLSKQLEIARLDEAESAPVIQVVDRALPPDRKAGPSRILIVILSAILGGVLASLVIILRAALPILRRTLDTATL